jgi:hypothetical protein
MLPGELRLACCALWDQHHHDVTKSGSVAVRQAYFIIIMLPNQAIASTPSAGLLVCEAGLVEHHIHAVTIEEEHTMGGAVCSSTQCKQRGSSSGIGKLAEAKVDAF